MRRSKGPWGSSGLDRAKLVKGEDDGVAIIHTRLGKGRGESRGGRGKDLHTSVE